jgi:RNA polymerase sigma-70 factor (ECF subfamily)
VPTRVAASKLISTSESIMTGIGRAKRAEPGNAHSPAIATTFPVQRSTIKSRGSISGVPYAQGQHHYAGSIRTGSAVAVNPKLRSQSNSDSSSISTEERIWSLAPAVETGNCPGWAKNSAESALLESAKSGCASAFGELSEWCRAPLLRIARRILRDEADAQDAVQDSLLNAFVNLSRFEGRSAFRTWATRITINCCLLRIRSRRKHHERRVEAEVSDEEHKEIGCATLNPEQAVTRDEEKRLLHLAIDALPEKLRRVVEIKELQDRTTEEAASLLGISVTATKARLFRAKGLLKRRVSSKWWQCHQHSRTGTLGRAHELSPHSSSIQPSSHVGPLKGT